jgi:hypothetical protein
MQKPVKPKLEAEDERKMIESKKMRENLFFFRERTIFRHFVSREND